MSKTFYQHETIIRATGLRSAFPTDSITMDVITSVTDRVSDGLPGSTLWAVLTMAAGKVFYKPAPLSALYCSHPPKYPTV